MELGYLSVSRRAHVNERVPDMIVSCRNIGKFAQAELKRLEPHLFRNEELAVEQCRANKAVVALVSLA